MSCSSARFLSAWVPLCGTVIQKSKSRLFCVTEAVVMEAVVFAAVLVASVDGYSPQAAEEDIGPAVAVLGYEVAGPAVEDRPAPGEVDAEVQ